MELARLNRRAGGEPPSRLGCSGGNSHSNEVIAMRAVFRATLVAVALGMLLSADVMAKGEAFGATIGPIDGITPGTPAEVPVQVTVGGQPMTRGDAPLYLTFNDAVSRDRLEFPLRYDASKSTFVAAVTLPHEGRWSVNVLLRFDAISAEQIGNITGTRMVTVPAAATSAGAQPATPPALPMLGGAALASAAWIAGIAAFALRRRREAALAARPSVGKQLPA
jgi:hypothetical protein